MVVLQVLYTVELLGRFITPEHYLPLIMPINYEGQVKEVYLCVGQAKPGAGFGTVQLVVGVTCCRGDRRDWICVRIFQAAYECTWMCVAEFLRRNPRAKLQFVGR